MVFEVARVGHSFGAISRLCQGLALGSLRCGGQGTASREATIRGIGIGYGSGVEDRLGVGFAYRYDSDRASVSSESSS